MKEPSASSLIRADAKLNFTELPSVFYLYTEETKGEPKHKYLVILSADRQEAYFFMIDSVRYWEGIGEIPVTPEELPCLSRNSWIDCRELFSVSREELVRRMAMNIDTYERGSVPNVVIERMRTAVLNSTTLMEWEIDLVLSALDNKKQ